MSQRSSDLHRIMCKFAVHTTFLLTSLLPAVVYFCFILLLGKLVVITAISLSDITACLLEQDIGNEVVVQENYIFLRIFTFLLQSPAMKLAFLLQCISQ